MSELLVASLHYVIHIAIAGLMLQHLFNAVTEALDLFALFLGIIARTHVRGHEFPCHFNDVSFMATLVAALEFAQK